MPAGDAQRAWFPEMLSELEQRNMRALEIQDNIRDVLMDKWDPIGVSGVTEAQDEYVPNKSGRIGEVWIEPNYRR